MPDGRRIVAARIGFNDLWRWDLSTGELLGAVSSQRRLWHLAPGGPPLAVAATDAGGIIVTSRIDGALVRLDLITGVQTGAWATPHGRIWALAPVTLPDGRLLVASGGKDGMVRLWDPVAGEAWGEPIEGLGTPLRIVPGVLPDGQVVLCIANSQGNVHTRDVTTGQAIGPRISTGWDPRGAVTVCQRLCCVRGSVVSGIMCR
jgi:WD40 repeat protein